MLLPAATGTGLAVFVTERSADPETITLTVALLFPPFGSVVADEIESVSGMVPDAPGATFKTKVKFAVVVAFRVPIVQLGGVVRMLQVHPAGPVRDTAEVFAGTGSVNETVDAVPGPLFVTL
jgi:hypothetical protein